MRVHARTAITVLMLTVLLAACGGARDVADDPRRSLQDAFERMSGWEGGSVTLRIDADVDSLIAADDTGKLTEDQARAVVDGRATIRSFAGPDLADRSDDEGEFLVETGDTTIVHLLIVGSEQLYVRAEVQETIDRFAPEHAPALDEAAGEAQKLGIDFAEEFFAGSWLSLQNAEEVSNMYGAMVGARTPEPEELESFRTEATASLERFLDDVAVEHLGRDDAGDHLRLVASATQLGELAVEILEHAGSLVMSQLGVPPDAMAEELRRDLADSPRVDVPIEIWLDDGIISSVGFDVVEFARRNGDAAEVEVPADVDRLVFLADLEEFRGGLETPGDAIEVDLAELMGGFMGGGFGGLDVDA